jgi:hypothetical protein
MIAIVNFIFIGFLFHVLIDQNDHFFRGSRYDLRDVNRRIGWYFIISVRSFIYYYIIHIKIYDTYKN